MDWYAKGTGISNSRNGCTRIFLRVKRVYRLNPRSIRRRRWQACLVPLDVGILLVWSFCLACRKIRMVKRVLWSLLLFKKDGKLSSFFPDSMKAQLFIYRVFRQQGLPMSISSYQASCFLSKFQESICQGLSTQLYMSGAD